MVPAILVEACLIAAAAGELLVLIAKLEAARGAQRSRELPGDAGELVARAREYIDAHYAEALTVEDLAKGCHVSLSYLYRVFAALHTSPVSRSLPGKFRKLAPYPLEGQGK